jgi:hypothetical protein
MFSGGEFDEVLAAHPEAASVMSTIRNEIAGNPRISFEESLQHRLDSRDGNLRHQIGFVPIALQEFFHKASTLYTSQPFNYSDLVNRTVCAGICTAFITVNYDTLLDQALTNSLREQPQFKSVQCYVSSENWLLMKAHGSVDWGYPWPEAFQHNDMLPAAREFELPKADTGSIAVGLGPFRMRREVMHYPAMALPASGKSTYGFVCPPSHEEAVKSFLEDCGNFLVIGFGARDQDVLNLLAEKVSKVRLLVIVIPSEHQPEVVQNLYAVPQFRAKLASLLDSHLYPSFTEFVKTGLDPLQARILTA